MYKPMLSHFRLNVHDLDKAVDFYSRILHLNIVERVDQQYAFLSGDDRHHVLAVFKVEAARDTRTARPGVDHIAFQVPGKKSFARAFQELVDSGVPVQAVDNAISWSLYFQDPEGNALEIFLDTRYEAHGANLWKGARNTLEPERILAALTEECAYVVPPPLCP